MSRLLVVAFVVVLVGCSESGGKRDKAVTKVRKEKIESRVTVGGSIVSNRASTILAPYSGYLTKMHVKIGQMVKTGDPLLVFTQTLRGVGEDPNPMRSPFEGRVTQVLHEQGEYVETGKDTSGLVRLDDTTKLFVQCDIPETDLSKLADGQTAIVRVNALPSKTYSAKITRIALAAKEAANKGRFNERVEFAVRLNITDADEQLRPGYSAVVDVVTDQREAALTLPHEYVDVMKGKYFVTLNDGARREVKIGLENADRVEVIEGVTEGDAVRLVDFTEERKG